MPDNNNTFSLTLALELGQLCQQAYAQYDAYKAGQTWALPAGFSLLQTLYAVYEGNALPLGFIARGGTDDLEEWVQDGKYDQITPEFLTPDIKVELGFHELYITAHPEHF